MADLTRTVSSNSDNDEETTFVAGEVFESRFKMSELLRDNGLVRYGLWEPPEIRITGMEPRFNLPVEMEHRPDLVSYRFYGTVDYWWVIAYVNNVRLPLRDLKAGMTLIIPLESEIQSALERTRA